jgi:predicted transcriptional regulator
MAEAQGGFVEVRSVPMRGRIDIMASMLDEVRFSAEGLRKTRIMYRCNLNFRQLNVYLKLLRDRKFVRVVLADLEGGKVEICKITEEGLSFLKAYDDLRESLNEERLTR